MDSEGLLEELQILQLLLAWKYISLILLFPDAPDGIVVHENIEDLFSSCTHISIHCNLSEETKNLVSLKLISLMPGIGADGVECGNHIVSCARGGIVEENDALQALDSGMLASLALDVFENEPLADSPFFLE